MKILRKILLLTVILLALCLFIAFCWVVPIIGPRCGPPSIQVYADAIEKGAMRYVCESEDLKAENYINITNSKIRIGNEFIDESIPEEERVSYVEAVFLLHEIVDKSGKVYGPYINNIDTIYRFLNISSDKNNRVFIIVDPDSEFKFLTYIVVTNGDLPEYDYKKEKVINAIKVYVRREYSSKVAGTKNGIY